jgi:hypothetical protein
MIASRIAKHIPYLLASHVDLTYLEGMGSHSRDGLKPVTFQRECFEIVLCSNAQQRDERIKSPGINTSASSLAAYIH